jgi:hypothetical protein
MNVKKSLGNHIRGWFPREPYLPTRSSPIQKPPAPSTPLDQKTILNLYLSELRPLIILGLLPILFVGYLQLYGIAADHYVGFPAFLIGISAGSLAGFFWTRRILRRLTESGEILFKSLRKQLFFDLPILWLIIPMLLLPWVELYLINAGWLFSVTGFGTAYLASYFVCFAAMSFCWETVNRKRIYSSARGELFAIPKIKKTTVNEKTKLSLRLGGAGGLFIVILSMVQLANSGSGFFWWSGSVVYGEIVVVSGLIAFAAGIIGLFGASIGKKLGGRIMIVAGFFGLISAPLYGVVFGGLMIAGGVVALIEKPKMVTTPGQDLFQ